MIEGFRGFPQLAGFVAYPMGYIFFNFDVRIFHLWLSCDDDDDFFNSFFFDLMIDLVLL